MDSERLKLISAFTAITPPIKTDLSVIFSLEVATVLICGGHLRDSLPRIPTVVKFHYVEESA